MCREDGCDEMGPAMFGPEGEGSVRQGHRHDPVPCGEELAAMSFRAFGRDDAGLDEGIELKEREGSGGGLLQAAVGVVVEPVEAFLQPAGGGGGRGHVAADGAGEPFVRIAEEGLGFVGLEREVAGDAHARVAAADGERQLVVLREAAHCHRAFDDTVLEDVLGLDQQGDDLGAVGVDGLRECRFRVRLELRREGDGEGAVAAGQVVVEQRERIEEFIARRDGAGAGRHDADGVAHDEGCLAGADSLCGGADRHETHGAQMLRNMDGGLRGPVFRKFDGIQNDDGRLLGGDRRDDAGDAAAADLSVVGDADVREDVIVAVKEFRLEVALAVEEIEDVRRVEIRQGENAFVDGEEMDEAGGGLAVFEGDFGLDGDVGIRADDVRDVELDVKLAGGLVDVQRQKTEHAFIVRPLGGDDRDGGVVGLRGHRGRNINGEGVVSGFDGLRLLGADAVFAADDEGVAVAVRLEGDGGLFTGQVGLLVGREGEDGRVGGSGAAFAPPVVEFKSCLDVVSAGGHEFVAAMVSDVERNDAFGFRKIHGHRIADGQGGSGPFVAELSEAVFLHGIFPVAFVELECDGAGQRRDRLVFLIGKDFIGDFDFVFNVRFVLAEAEELLGRQGDDGGVPSDGASARLVDRCVRNERDRGERHAVHGVEAIEGDRLLAFEIVVFENERLARQEGGGVADAVFLPVRRRFGRCRSDAERTFRVRDIRSEIVFADDFEIRDVGMKADDTIGRDGDFDAVRNISGHAEVGLAPNDVFLWSDFDVIGAGVGVLREGQPIRCRWDRKW